MAPAPGEGAIREELEKVLTSPGFCRNERLSGFLRFIVERQLEGREGELKETVIATEVLGRRADYNPKQDAIVRTEAGRLRSRLSEYYLGEGASDRVVIDLPKGGYVPVFRPVEQTAASPSPPPRSFSGWLVAGVGAVVLIAGLAWWMQARTLPAPIAVLPLENLSHRPTDDYLADGLTDELIRTLATFEGLAPRSRTSSFALKGKGLNARQAGQQLGADYIVEGSVLRSGDQLRVNAQLVRVRDEVLMWSGKFERPVSHVLDLQEEISRTIVASLPLRLGNGRKFGTVNPEAYDLYMRAESLGLMDGLPLLQDAVVKDPAFAEAQASLASALAYRTGNVVPDLRTDLPRMRTAAQRAVQLDPLLPEAHSALGMSFARDGKWDDAEKSFRRAIELNPNRSESYGEFSVYVLMQEERIPESLGQMRLAQKSDPLSPEVISELAYVLLSSHRYDEADTECEKLPEDCHCWPAPTERVRDECLGRVRIGQGRLREAIEILSEGVKSASMGVPMRGYLALALGRAGQTAEAEKFIETDWKNPYHQALAYIGLGDKSRAIDAMERMESNGPVRVGLALAVPELDSIRNDPRTRALRARLGLPR